jgi:hypothetical protein
MLVGFRLGSHSITPGLLLDHQFGGTHIRSHLAFGLGAVSVVRRVVFRHPFSAQLR